MELRELMFLHGTADKTVNLFDISKVKGKSGVTVRGNSFSGTANKLSNIGDIALTETIPSGKSIRISGYAYTEGNKSTETTLGLTIKYKKGTTVYYADVVNLMNDRLTEEKFSVTKTLSNNTNVIRFSPTITPENIWHIRDLKVEIVDS